MQPASPGRFDCRRQRPSIVAANPIPETSDGVEVDPTESPQRHAARFGGHGRAAAARLFPRRQWRGAGVRRADPDPLRDLVLGLRHQCRALDPGQDRHRLRSEGRAAPIAPYKDKVTVLSGFNCILGGKPNLRSLVGRHGDAHRQRRPPRAAWAAAAPMRPTIDCLVADAIGSGTRFRSLEVACTGQPSVSYSMRAGSTVNPSEVDPVSLYKRIFGPEFKDPNAAEFKPDPAIMLRQSVLSSVKDDRDALMRTVGAADRARVDQYFTSLRRDRAAARPDAGEAGAGRGLRDAEGARQDRARPDLGSRGQEPRPAGASWW